MTHNESDAQSRPVQRRWIAACLGSLVLPAMLLLALTVGAGARERRAEGDRFTFAVTCDMRGFAGPAYDTVQYFRGAVEAIASLGGGAFMVSPGDIDPPPGVLWTITRTLGTAYTWYPVVGNHELPLQGGEPYTGANMIWLRGYGYGVVNPGPTGCPTTTYSFDYKNAHFVMLNEYCTEIGDTGVISGDVSDHLYNWLSADLSATQQAHIFVFGHEPAYPQPDADNGRERHIGDSLDQYPAHRDRFWNLLKDEGVIAYICGHTHNYSAVNVDGVWQLDAGHARGLGDQGARSTFILIHVYGPVVTFETYRDDASGGSYTLMHDGILAGRHIYLPMAMCVRSPFTFAVTSDVHGYAGPAYDTAQYFRGAVEAIAGLGGGAFMVSPGDIDPPPSMLWTITRTLGTAYTWYPVVGNHELPGLGIEPYTGANMVWLRGYDYGAVNPGPTGCPTTTYSFDYKNAHFAILNEYCSIGGDTVTAGDVSDHLYNWLSADLSATQQAHIFVFGHEPAYPQPDADNGRERHIGDSLDQYPAHRDRFWNLLKDEGVIAYICGHTHNYSAVNVDGVWQLDAGHASGLGDQGARSTFILIHVYGPVVTFETYRDDARGGPYTWMHGGMIAGVHMRIYLPVAMHAYSGTR